jgi:hypothetical protein
MKKESVVEIELRKGSVGVVRRTQGVKVIVRDYDMQDCKCEVRIITDEDEKTRVYGRTG